MNANMQPDCLNDFLFSNANERKKLERILSRKRPFPHNGISGILLHGTWGSGKSTLAKLLPCLLETSYSGSYDLKSDIGQMPAEAEDEVHVKLFRCGGGVNITKISQQINQMNSYMPFYHHSKHDYFIFDEIDKLTISAQQSLKTMMNLKRCMFFFSTNYLSKIDEGIINRCILVEMNQITDPAAYLPLAKTWLKKMGVADDAVADSVLISCAKDARGSLRQLSEKVLDVGFDHDGSLSP